MRRLCGWTRRQRVHGSGLGPGTRKCKNRGPQPADSTQLRMLLDAKCRLHFPGFSSYSKAVGRLQRSLPKLLVDPAQFAACFHCLNLLFSESAKLPISFICTPSRIHRWSCYIRGESAPDGWISKLKRWMPQHFPWGQVTASPSCVREWLARQSPSGVRLLA